MDITRHRWSIGFDIACKRLDVKATLNNDLGEASLSFNCQCEMVDMDWKPTSSSIWPISSVLSTSKKDVRGPIAKYRVR